jgi:hypothetical protein
VKQLDTRRVKGDRMTHLEPKDEQLISSKKISRGRGSSVSVTTRLRAG